MKKKRLNRKEKLKSRYFHCYSNKLIFTEDICSDDGCKMFIPCKIMCGYKIDMFEYALVNTLNNILTYTEIIEILMKNYSITKNAAKMGIKRYNKIIKNEKEINK